MIGVDLKEVIEANRLRDGVWMFFVETAAPVDSADDDQSRFRGTMIGKNFKGKRIESVVVMRLNARCLRVVFSVAD